MDDPTTEDQSSRLNGDLVLIEHPPPDESEDYLSVTPRIMPLGGTVIDGEQKIWVGQKALTDKKIAELDPDQSIFALEYKSEQIGVDEDGFLWEEHTPVYRSIGKLSESKAYQLAMQRLNDAKLEKQRAKEEKANLKKAAKPLMDWVTPKKRRPQ